MPTFQIGSYTTIKCPVFGYEPGALVYSYQNGSQVMLGAPQCTATWNFRTDDEVALIWDVYNTLVTGGTVTALTGNPVNVTVPDFINGGLRLTTAYMTRPTGKAVGDGTQNLSVTFYNLHATSMETAINNPLANYADIIMSGGTLTVGVSEYPGTGWQY
jgi:hypothetical protein